jgi:hypothetical protein
MPAKLMLAALTLLAATVPLLAADKPAPESAWSAQAAARYLDSRETWWQGWDHAQKDHGTLCVSCHTQAPYALARPALRAALGEAAATPQEETMLASIRKRVEGWSKMAPFYSDETSGAGKEVESRNAEAVLNAIVLSGYDAGRPALSDTARLAFSNAWALQSAAGPDAGAWVWQNFKYAPWESRESQYHFAALMAVAVGKAPGRYRNDPKIAANLARLRDYLRSHYDAQPMLNKIVALWASHWFPDLVTNAQRDALLGLLYGLQKPDGGWSLAGLGPWQRRDNTPIEFRPDGYATGLIVLVLEGVAINSHADPRIARGLQWLQTNQDKTTGAWPAWSLNKDRDPSSNAGQFMSDAATAYAVLALEHHR